MHRRRSRIRDRLPVAGAVLLALVAAACAGDQGDRAPRMPAAPVTATPSEQAGSPQGDQGTTEDASPAPRELRFTAPALGGGQVRGREFAGRDLVIWFWAPW
jgi:hypothetical protein